MTTRLYYYNTKWQVLSEYNGWNVCMFWYGYGNGIDEFVVLNIGYTTAGVRYYLHDHLGSAGALVWANGTVVERYEYDAHGEPTIWDATFSTKRTSSLYANPYMFTGRRAKRIRLTMRQGTLRPTGTETGALCYLSEETAGCKLIEDQAMCCSCVEGGHPRIRQVFQVISGLFCCHRT